MNNGKARVWARRGFTLIEIMIVVIIVGTMATIVTVNLLGNVDKARQTKARTDIQSFSSALLMYNIDNGGYPTTDQGLKALIEKPTGDPAPTSWQPGGYLQNIKEIPKDPWGNLYIYRSPGDNGEAYVIISRGKDGREGGEDFNEDIVSGEIK